MIGLGIGFGVSEFRIKTGSSFIPDTISGLKLWLDASDPSTIYQSSGGSQATADGDPVGFWSDKSGSLNHAFQSSGTNKPALKLAIKNEKNVVRFDGVNDSLDCGTALGKPANFTIFAVFRVQNTSARYAICGSGDNNGASNTSWGVIDVNQGGVAGAVALHHSDGTNFSITRTAGSVIAGNTFSLGCTKYTSGNTQQSFRKNAADVANATVLFSGASSCGGTPYKFVLGQFGEYVGINLNGDIAEFLVYNQALSLSDLQKVEDYLNTKWSIY